MMAAELFKKLGGLDQPQTKNNDGKLEITAEESKRLEECFKDRKFRDLLAEYCEEISNPKTRLAYEEYLKQVEREQSQPTNRKLIKPKASFCIKLRKDPKKMKLTKSNERDIKQSMSLKVFINCCSADYVENAKLGPNQVGTRPLSATGDERAGICWQIPYVLGHMRSELDSVGKYCEVVDIAFSLNTMEACKQDVSFGKIVIQTAIEAVEENSKFKFHEKYKILKNIASKGEPALMSVNTSQAPTMQDVFKDKNGNGNGNGSSDGNGDNGSTKFVNKDEAKSGNKKKNNKHKNKKNKGKSKESQKDSESVTESSCRADHESIIKSKSRFGDRSELIDEMDEKTEELLTSEKEKEKEKKREERIVTPKYRILESGDMNMQEYWSDQSLLVAPIRRPQRLIVKISLPNLKNIANVNANVLNEEMNDKNDKNGEMTKMIHFLELKGENKEDFNETYYLKIKLPYLVVTNETENENEKENYKNNKNNKHIEARWYDATKELHITLTVLPISKDEMMHLRQQMEKIKVQTQNVTKIENRNENDNETTNVGNVGRKEENENENGIECSTESEHTTVDKENNKSDGSNGEQMEETNTNYDLIDEILDLKTGTETQTRDTMDDNNGTVNDNSTEVTKESKQKKKNKKKKHGGTAVKAGFLLNNKNINLSNSKNLKHKAAVSSELLNNETVNVKNEKETIIKEMKDFEFEFRERLDRIVIIYRIENIIKSTINVQFNKLSLTVSFETENGAYYKCFDLCNEINCDESSFDLNSKNLLIMLIKQEDTIWNSIETTNKVAAPSVENNEKECKSETTREICANGNDMLDDLLNDDSTMEIA